VSGSITVPAAHAHNSGLFVVAVSKKKMGLLAFKMKRASSEFRHDKQTKTSTYLSLLAFNASPIVCTSIPPPLF